jgi:hypothetical protein
MGHIEERILLGIDNWIATGRYRCMKTLRQLAETEENYMIISREITRVEAQVQRARKQEALATLTLVEWVSTLDYFGWMCAYCQERSFQVMSHVLPLAEGGTTRRNCVPACHRCRGLKQKDDRYIQAFLASLMPVEAEYPLHV